MHRDVKLENFMFCNGMVKMIDFGCSKKLDDRNETSETVLGTP